MRLRGVMIALALAAALSLSTSAAQAAPATGLEAVMAKAKKKSKAKRCRKGYIRRSVKVKRWRRVHGKRKRVTVRVRRCVKVKKKSKAKTPAPGSPPAATPPAATAPQAPAGGTVDQRHCLLQPGAGRFTNPIQIGTVTRTTVLRFCPPLTSGAGFNVRYFSFTLRHRPRSGSAVASRYTTTPQEQSAVHPRIADPAGWTLLTSSANGFWIGDPPLGRGISITSLGPGTYVLGMEKLSSPLGSTNTPWFDVVVFLN